MKKKTMRQLSIAVGFLSFLAFVIQGYAKTWGFEALGEQIVQSILVVSAGINIYFGGTTSAKVGQEKDSA